MLCYIIVSVGTTYDAYIHAYFIVLYCFSWAGWLSLLHCWIRFITMMIMRKKVLCCCISKEQTTIPFIPFLLTMCRYISTYPLTGCFFGDL